MDDRARALAELQAIAGEIEQVRARRDDLIRAAVAAGVPRRQVALAAKVSRSTVYAAAPIK